MNNYKFCSPMNWVAHRPQREAIILSCSYYLSDRVVMCLSSQGKSKFVLLKALQSIRSPRDVIGEPAPGAVDTSVVVAPGTSYGGCSTDVLRTQRMSCQVSDHPTRCWLTARIECRFTLIRDRVHSVLHFINGNTENGFKTKRFFSDYYYAINRRGYCSERWFRKRYTPPVTNANFGRPREHAQRCDNSNQTVISG